MLINTKAFGFEVPAGNVVRKDANGERKTKCTRKPFPRSEKRLKKKDGAETRIIDQRFGNCGGKSGGRD